MAATDVPKARTEIREENQHVGPIPRIGIAITVYVLPLALAATAIVALFNGWLFATLPNLALGITLYFLSGFGVTAGFHRLFTHRAFKTGPITRAIFAVLGSMSVQGPVIDWVATHRQHHAHSDKEGDPHSPHVGPGGKWRKFWHAHTGWLTEDEKAIHEIFAQDLLRDPIVSTVSKLFLPIVFLSFFVIPFAFGMAVTGTVDGGWGGVLWGGAVRVFLLHHATWSVNSACHLWGERPFETGDQSTNNKWAVPFTMGEAWHHNHHKFPTSAEHGLLPGQFDPTYKLITVLERFGLAWDVRLETPEDIASELQVEGRE